VFIAHWPCTARLLNKPPGHRDWLTQQWRANALQLATEGYFRGRNAGGWTMLPNAYWTGVSRLDQYDTWKLPSGLEVGQVRV
jgi:hypothetical protein